MNEGKHSPAVIPMAMIHIGVISMLTSLLAAVHRDGITHFIGIAVASLSLTLILAGLITILLFRKNPSYSSDAANALTALTIFHAPIIAYLVFPFSMFFLFPYVVIVILLLTILVQFFIAVVLNVHADNYARVFDVKNKNMIKALLFIYFFVMNACVFLLYHEFMMVMLRL